MAKGPLARQVYTLKVGKGKSPYRTPAPRNALPCQASRAGRREVEDGSRGSESGLSGWIIYEKGYAGETALLIRVPEKGLGRGIIEARAGGILKSGGRRESRKGEGRKRKQEPPACGLSRRRLSGLEL